jgi:hypothetical protein
VFWVGKDALIERQKGSFRKVEPRPRNTKASTRNKTQPINDQQLIVKFRARSFHEK